MGKRKHDWKMIGSLLGSIKHKKQKKAHFTFGHVGMEVTEGGGHKRQKNNHEAEMIPGLGPLEYGFPNSIITKLRYHDIFVYNSTTGAPAPLILRANGLFDPDYSNTGHQPLFRDNYASIYDYYVVLGSKVTVTFQSNSATSPFICGIVTSDTPTISTTLDTLCEQNNAVHTVIGNMSAPNKTLFMTYSPLENIGAVGEDDLSMLTAVGNDPSVVQYFGVWVATADATTTAGCIVDFTIEYTVKFATLSKQVQN